MSKMKKLIDVFPNFIEGSGFFSELNKLNVPWNVSAMDLDLEYIGNHSGDKPISPLVNKLLVDGELTPVNVTRLAKVVFSMNHENWDRLYLALQEEYNPLQNYNGTETRTVVTDESGSSTLARTGTESTDSDLVDTSIKSGNEVYASSGSDSLKKTGTESTDSDLADTTIKSGSEVIASSGSDSVKRTGTDTETVDSDVSETKNGTNNTTTSNSSDSKNSGSKADSIYGFNSTSDSPSDKSVTSSTGTETSSGTDNTTINETKGTDIDTTTTNTHNTTDTQTYGKSDTHTYNNVKDERSNNASSVLTLDTTDTQTYGKSDTHTYNNVKDERSNTGSSVLTLDTTDTGSTSGHSESVDSMHREGNYGIRTSQEMIEQEFELRIKYRFFDVVFGDIDKTLCLAIY